MYLKFMSALAVLYMNVCIPPLSAQHFIINETQEGLEIMEEGQRVLFYQKMPKSLEGQYERSNYVHPLYGLQGEVLTEDFPEDHPHHHGIFWAWHQIIVDGEKIADGWTSEKIVWDVEEVQKKSNKNQAALKSKVYWKSMLNGSQPDSIVLENTKITVYRSTSQFRMLDFEIQLTALVDSLQIGGSEDVKGYGGFSPRLKLPDDIQFISQNQEITPENTAVKAGPWMDFYGSFNGDDAPKSGVALFSHPDNPCHPQPWILRAEKSMQNVVYPGRTPVDLPKEKPLTLKYRLVIHSDDIDQNSLEQLYNQYTKN